MYTTSRLYRGRIVLYVIVYLVHLYCSHYNSSHSFADSNWHHLLFKWDVLTGDWSFLVDNKFEFQSSFTSSAIPFPGGHLILGQSQNSIQKAKGLMADIMHFNMWEHVFTDAEAQEMYSSCSVQLGNQLGTLVSWPEIQLRLHGDVKSVEFVRCRVNGTPFNFVTIKNFFV